MKTMLMAMLVLLFSALQALPARADDLRCSAGWDFDGNGFTGTLNVTVAADGSLTGTVYGDPIQGFYNNVSDEIMFIRSPNGSGNPADQQVYTGYYWAEGGFDKLAGFFEAFANSGASAGRHRYGFEASCQIIGSPVAGAVMNGPGGYGIRRSTTQPFHRLGSRDAAPRNASSITSAGSLTRVTRARAASERAQSGRGGVIAARTLLGRSS